MIAFVRPGMLVGERWELTGRLGRGAMGEVWAAVDRKTGGTAAVKLPRPEALADPDWVARFRREATVLARLKSPHICALRGTGEVRGVPFLVLEQLEGETLSACLRREGPLPWSDVHAIGLQLFTALVAAHRAGVLHRDINPENVFLGRSADLGAAKARGPAAQREPIGVEGSAIQVKLLDFGVADAVGAAQLTPDEATIGALAYVAPEQLGSAGSADGRSDVYAVGSVLVHALSGVTPFGGVRGARLVALKRACEAPSLDELTGMTWPAPLTQFLAKAMAMEAKRRFASAEVALAAFRSVGARIAGGVKALAPEPTTSDLPDRTATASARGHRRQRR